MAQLDPALTIESALGDAARLESARVHLEMQSRRGTALPELIACAILTGLLLLYAPMEHGAAFAAAFVSRVFVRAQLLDRYFRLTAEQRQAQLRAWRALNAAGLGGVALLWIWAAFLGFRFGPPAMQPFWTFVLLCIAFLHCHYNRFEQAVVSLAVVFGGLALAWATWGGAATRDAAPVLTAALAFLLWDAWHAEKRQRAYAGVVVRQQDLAEQLARRNEQLVQASRSRSALIAAASHDLRQPVQALGLLTQLMETAPPAALRDLVVASRCCADRLTDMLTQLLDFHRLDIGLHTPAPQAVDLPALLEDLREQFGRAATDKGLAFDIRAAPLTVMTDRWLLHRLLACLIDNAIKFTSTGHVRIDCSASDGGVRLVVADTGVGISPDRMEDVFQAYVRSPSERPEWQEGLGLGLSIVRRAIAQLAYQGTIDSQPGRGTRFMLQLGAAVPRAANLKSGSPFAGCDAACIAVIDNDATLLEALLDMLRGWGYAPVGATSLAALLHRLPRDAAPALVLSDLHLAREESGLAAVARVRRAVRQATLPAILLTGDLDPAIEVRARQEGLLLAHKPLRPAALLRLVQQALAGHAGC